MKDHDYDFVIAGAGLSGLALATSLIDQNVEKTVALIDKRTEYKRDHIWSSWTNLDGTSTLPFDYTWNKWQVSRASETSASETRRYPYRAIFSESYYEHALEKIQNSDAVDLFLGESIDGVHFNNDGVSVTTGSRTLRAKLFFDSRPPDIDHAQLSQDFFGIIVKSVEKKFDPSCVTLMDFAEFESKSYGFHFFYILPFSEYEALVESVFVGLERLSLEDHRARITRYLDEHFSLKVFAEVHLESGHIPMHPMKKLKTHQRHYLIGTPAGLIRPSTGYGFASINRFSQRLAEALRNEDFPKVPSTYSNKAKILDTVLLSLLKTRASDAPLIFSELFRRVEPDTLVRFLCDASSPQDDARVLAAMPRKFELGLILASLAIPGLVDMPGR